MALGLHFSQLPCQTPVQTSSTLQGPHPFIRSQWGSKLKDVVFRVR